MRGDPRPKARTNDLVVQNLEDETLVYDMNTNYAYCLNGSMSAVWQACDGNNGILDIAQMLARDLGASIDSDFVRVALDRLVESDLIENKDDLKSEFVSFSRREALRRIGISGMAALPLISSILAPPAAAAQSPVACGTVVCTIDAQCTVVGCGTCNTSTGRCRNP